MIELFKTGGDRWMHSSKLILDKCLWGCLSVKIKIYIWVKFYVKRNDTIIQHNSEATLYISDFYCENSGKLIDIKKYVKLN